MTGEGGIKTRSAEITTKPNARSGGARGQERRRKTTAGRARFALAAGRPLFSFLPPHLSDWPLPSYLK